MSEKKPGETQSMYVHRDAVEKEGKHVVSTTTVWTGRVGLILGAATIAAFLGNTALRSYGWIGVQNVDVIELNKLKPVILETEKLAREIAVSRLAQDMANEAACEARGSDYPETYCNSVAEKKRQREAAREMEERHH